MLGFGIVNETEGEGVTADVTGTSTLLASHSEKPLVHPGIQNLRHVVEGWIPFTITECGGLSMKWFRDVASAFAGLRRDDPRGQSPCAASRAASAAQAGGETSYEKLIEMAGEAPPGSDGLLFYPYMLGERRRENTTSRGGFYGITLNHSAPHFVRAVMEGVALAFGKDLGLFAELGSAAKRILCVGGGTRNELWNRIKADVARMPLELSDEPEAGLKGAALLGAAGVGLVDDIVKTAVERRKTGRKVEPTPANYEAYGRALAEHVRMYDHMLGYWK
jgi:sugar (pentulose or hexulose) kinase